MSRKGENIRRRSDGRWEARVLLGHETTGKTIYRSIYGNTYAEVREKRNILLAERILIEAEAKKRETTLEELAEEWLAFIKKACSMWQSTRIRYLRTVRRRERWRLKMFRQTITG
ncbi:MAG: hypothetical protein KH452_09745 [Clostridiales bacterium]|nr:hypothetical protein [Clostridiales bacterium]